MSEFKKIKPHSEVVEEEELKKYDPDNPNADPDPLYDELKRKEEEMGEKLNQVNNSLSDDAKAAIMGNPEIETQESEETDESGMQDILDQQKPENRDSIIINGKKIKSHEKYVLEEDLKQYDDTEE